MDICVLRLRQGWMQEFLGLKGVGGLDLQIWDLNRVHETKRTVFFQYHSFSPRVDADYHINETNSVNCSEK